MYDHDDTTITPRPPRKRRVLWTAGSILAAGALLAGGAAGLSTLRSNAGPLPTNPPTPTPSVSYAGTWKVITVPGVQTGVHVPAPQYTTPAPRVVTKTVPVPGPTVTVPGPTVTRTVQVPGPAVTVTVRCTVTVDASAPPADPAPVCTTDAPAD